MLTWDQNWKPTILAMKLSDYKIQIIIIGSLLWRCFAKQDSSFKFV